MLKNKETCLVLLLAIIGRVFQLILAKLCTYQCNAGGGGGRAWGGDLMVFVVPGVGHLTDVVLPGKGIFESFFARRGDI